MTTIIFSDKDILPSNEHIREALGEKYLLWEKIVGFFEQKYDGVAFEWKFYGKKNGWLCKNEVRGRNIFFFVPGNNEFGLTFAFGDKAVEEILNGDFPESVVTALKSCKKYAEGRVLQRNIENTQDCKTAYRLIAIKTEN